MADQVRVIGLRETLAALDRFGVEAQNLPAVTRIQQALGARIMRRAPRLTGRLARTTRVTKSPNRLVATGTQPYAAKAQRRTQYLTRSVEEVSPEAVRQITADVDRIANGLGFTTT